MTTLRLIEKILILNVLVFAGHVHGSSMATGRVETVVVATRAPKNPSVEVHYRVPAGYDASRREPYRVLVVFGGRNTNGKADAGGRLGWGAWADAEGVFLVSPGFTDDTYWQPDSWSGQALAGALSRIQKKYAICTTKMLFYGHSAGAQCSNLFAAWRPSWARAWVSHGCGVFHEPHSKMRGIPGLVTCGDADTARYLTSRDFVVASRQKGIDILWKSFPNHPHDVPPGSLELARAFLSHYHNLHRADLAPRNTVASSVATKRMAPPFIGDDMDGIFYPTGDIRVEDILAEDRVELPTREIAQAWGEAARWE